ncbi:MAG: cytochrome P450 [Solirubrobacteraceae bacterium]
MATKDFPHASLVEGLRFTAQVAIPNVIQGLFRRRRTAAAAATKAGADGLAVSFIGGLLRSYGEGPLWIRVAKDEALLLLGRDAIRHGLQGSPEPFAADPEPKKSAMERFQPDALTISRDREWSDRRRFTEAVLDTDRPAHRLGDRFAAVAVEAAQALPAQLDWETWNAAVRRVARQVILGPGAADDDELSQMLGELMDKSNPPGRGDAELLERYTQRLQGYVDAAQDGSLVGLFSQAPSTELTEPARQVTHWLFALGDTLAINALRALALLAVHDTERERAGADEAFLGACLQEAMRLWPTTAMLSRVTAHDTDWDGVRVPEGTQLLIVNTFNHRDWETIEFADRFDPEQWLSGDAGGDWQFNHFSHGPQGCPGAGLSLLVGQAMLGTVVREHGVRLEQPGLDPGKPMPHTLDFFALKFELSPPA